MRPRCRWLVVASLLGGCIIPDAGIVVQDEFLNMGAVRIVEPTPVTVRADEDCAELPAFNGCPQVPVSLPSGRVCPSLRAPC